MVSKAQMYAPGLVIGGELAGSGTEIVLDLAGNQFAGDTDKKTFAKVSTWAKIGIGTGVSLVSLLYPKMSGMTRLGLAAWGGHMVAEIPKLALAAYNEIPVEEDAQTRARRRRAALGRTGTAGRGVGRAGRTIPGPVPPGRVGPEEPGFPVGQSWGRYSRVNGSVSTSRFRGR